MKIGQEIVGAESRREGATLGAVLGATLRNGIGGGRTIAGNGCDRTPADAAVRHGGDGKELRPEAEAMAADLDRAGGVDRREGQAIGEGVGHGLSGLAFEWRDAGELKVAMCANHFAAGFASGYGCVRFIHSWLQDFPEGLMRPAVHFTLVVRHHHARADGITVLRADAVAGAGAAGCACVAHAAALAGLVGREDHSIQSFGVTAPSVAALIADCALKDGILSPRA